LQNLVSIVYSTVAFEAACHTVCPVVQYCYNGHSNKYRKWHFWGCCPGETHYPIDTKRGMDDSVVDSAQYPIGPISPSQNLILKLGSRGAYQKYKIRS